MPRRPQQQYPDRRPKGEVKNHRCEECGAFMLLRWSGRRTQWFYGCSTFPDCYNTFNAHPKTGAPQPGQNPPDLRKRPPKKPKKHATLWDVLLDDQYLEPQLPPQTPPLKFVVGAAIERTFTYWNGQDIWTTHPERVKLYASRAEAESVLNTTGGDFIEEVNDEADFRLRV